MKLWTYRFSCPQRPFWTVTDNKEGVYVEYGDGRFEWRFVKTGKKVPRLAISSAEIEYRGKQLERQYWPQWALELDYHFVDEGL